MLQRRLAREKAARLESEAIAERVTTALHETVQQLTRSSRTARLLGEVAVLANSARTVSEAMAGTLASVCASTGWQVGHALARTDKPNHSLVSLGVWQLADPARFEPFRAATEQMSFPLGTGMPGQVLQSGGLLSVPDLAAANNFPRAAAAALCGLVAGVALPVLVRDETAAVLEFFTTTADPPDDELLQVMSLVGAQLGRVLERDSAEQQLSRKALFDDLTGLANRALLTDRLRTGLEKGHRAQQKVSVVYLDVDDFKSVNDSRGHAAGDQLLTALADRLQDIVRQTDGVFLTAPTTVARLGGDEFALVLDNCPDPTVVAHRVQSDFINRPLPFADAELFVSLSLGTATSSPDCDTPEEILAAANLAMHEAKRTGKARSVPYRPAMKTAARERQTMGEDLHLALRNNEFHLAFQPVVCLSDGKITGAEALLRWPHPVRGPVPPDHFIPRAEETGIIVPLGAWVLGESCRRAATWQADRDSSFTIAVNVSGRQLREPDFVTMVINTLSRSALPPSSLCLELTESILMENDDHVIQRLDQLRDLGISLAIDDFGTGYSSLGALRQLPVDLLKIDRSFVRGLPDDGDAARIARAIVGLGHTLGLRVLAEGVETAEQRDLLRSYGCDEAQGYLFGRPQPAEEFTAQLNGPALIPLSRPKVTCAQVAAVPGRSATQD